MGLLVFLMIKTIRFPAFQLTQNQNEKSSYYTTQNILQT